MNKSELISAIAKKTSLEKKAIDKVLVAFTEVVEKTVKADDKVQLIGFGTFERRSRAARAGRDPRTGAEIKIPACKVPAFKAGKKFKDAVAGK